MRSLRELAKTAANHGVTIAVETVRPEESRVVITLPELARLLKDVDSPWVKAGLDTVAMGVAGETPRQWFETLGRDIVHTHFIDGRPYAHLVWGDGLYPHYLAAQIDANLGEADRAANELSQYNALSSGFAAWMRRNYPPKKRTAFRW